MKTMKLVFLMSLAILIGCATNLNNGIAVGQKGEDSERWPTLYVVNTGIDVIRIYESGNRRIGTVYPGQSTCIQLRNPESIRELSFGFLAGFDRYRAVQQRFDRGQNWTWNINSSLPAISEIDIYPTERCE